MSFCLCYPLCLVCAQEAEGLYKTMVKRFRQNKAVWLNYGTFLLQQGQSDAASALLQRALKSLPSKESKTAGPNTEDQILGFSTGFKLYYCHASSQVWM